MTRSRALNLALLFFGLLGPAAFGCSSGDDSGSGGDMAGAGASTGTLKCTITSSLTMSPVISTVASVTFTTDLAAMDDASIEYGLDDSYGMTAPVDLAEPDYKTVLLGMKPLHEYHYRVVASAGGEQCKGPDNTLMTGAPPNKPQLPKITIDTPQPDELNGGFMLSGVFNTGPAFILDSDGDYVWWYDSGDASRVLMSYDGKYMWIRNVNVNGGAPLVTRVSMDGTDVQTFDIDSEFGDSHHDFVVEPDESILFLQHEADVMACDKVMERKPDGSVHEIINAMAAHGGSMCHINSIHYFKDDDTISWSDLDQNCYVKMTHDGQVLWVLGGDKSDFTTGSGAVWSRQHGHQILGPDRMLMFENGNAGDHSMVYELMLDQAAGSAERVWTYDGNSTSFVMGDVQRLANGNTLVTYSTSGTVQEVDPDGNLVRSLVLSLGGAIGYMQLRESLYGPPPY